MVGSCGTGTSAPTSIQDLKPGQVSRKLYIINVIRSKGGVAMNVNETNLYEMIARISL
jgi:hypothetical protein